MKRALAFTLAELLIALVIIGEIATFTIPKLLQNQQNGQKKAIFRESVATIADILHTSVVTRTLTVNVPPSQIFLPKLNGVKVCDTNSVSQGCIPAGTWAGIVAEDTQAGVVLHNGAVLYGIQPAAQSNGRDGFVIDYNGNNGPNLEGTDQLYVRVCYDKSGTGFTSGGDCSRGEDTLDYYGISDNVAGDQVLWNWIFQ